MASDTCSCNRGYCGWCLQRRLSGGRSWRGPRCTFKLNCCSLSLPVRVCAAVFQCGQSASAALCRHSAVSTRGDSGCRRSCHGSSHGSGGCGCEACGIICCW